MIIENPDVFKTWLTSILEPLCDADPAALAKYVYALVKKDKPIEELREGMLDQLDVFLQNETKPFVDMLFKSLETNEYLKSEVKQPSPPPEDAAAKEPEIEAEPRAPTADPSPEAPTEAPAVAEPRPASPPRRRVVKHAPVAPLPRAPPKEQTLVKVMPLSELLDEPVDNLPRRRDRRSDSLRDKEERRRRVGNEAHAWDRRGGRGRRRSPVRTDRPDRIVNRRLTSRSPSPRRPYRNRSPPPPPLADRLGSRSRSRSPVMRKRVAERAIGRELERDRMSRDREHRERADRSRDRSREMRSRSRDRSPTPPRDNGRISPPAFKRRCRDFDVKGYCMRGDLCQWDHGTDPLVLEDSTLTRALTLPPPVPEYNPLAPDIWCAPPAPFPAFPPPPPARELLPVPRIREPIVSMQASVPAMPVRAAQHPHNMQLHSHQPKKSFDYNRLGGHPRPPLNQNQVKCSLEVKKVPRGLNDITHLNTHFSKFGKIVNIQVNFEGDPEGALITFSNPTEANVAYKSTEAVLNNRFIKVFWYNPENKQENVPPSVPANQPPTERPASQHPGSHNKVLINKDNMKATADTNKAIADKQAKEQIAANGAVPVKPVETSKQTDKSRQVMEMHKRAQTLLETQLQQQTLLIHKLESGQVTGPQKAALMEAINSAQEGIEKLRKELVAYNKMIKQVQANAKRPKTREEWQKEILDAELDMFTKQQEGQDVTELMKKITDLRRQMATQFPPHPAARRPHSRGGRFNPATRFVRNAHPVAPKVFNNQCVDHRPRALLVSGFESDEVAGLVKHFAQFGEITGKEVNLAVPELIVQFKVRAQAEAAAARGRHYNERTLSITWVTNNKPITPVAAAPAAPELAGSNPASNSSMDTSSNSQQGEANPPEESPLRFLEEEEEDADEDRSWRR